MNETTVVKHVPAWWQGIQPAVLLLLLLAGVLLLLELAPGLYKVFPAAVYLPFHAFVEFMAAMIAGMVFGVGWHSYNRNRPGTITILACAFLSVGLLNFGHLLSYPGMPDFVTPSSPAKAIYFWLATNGVLALALLAVAALPWRPFVSDGARWVFLGSALGIVAIAYWTILYAGDRLPVVFVPGAGLSPFKVGMEYLILALYLPAIVLLFGNRARPAGCDTRLLAVGATVLALSEWCFIRYTSVSDIWNTIGHLNKIVGYVLIYRAVFISGVREPYASLRLSETRARQDKITTQVTLDAIGDAVIKLDAQGDIVYLNPAARNMLGLAEQEAIGDPFSSVVHIVNEKHEAVPFPIPSFILPAAARDTASRLLLVRNDGIEIPIEDTAATIFDEEGSITGAVITLRDMTERQRAQRALRQSGHMFHDLLEFAPDAIVISDEHGHIKGVNGQAENLFGYDRVDMIGQSIEILIPRHLRGEHDRYRKSYHGQPHPRSMGAGLDIYCMRKDGTEFPGDISLGPLETEEGALVMAVVRDVTERRRQEAELREAARYARSLIEANLDPLMVVSVDGKITDANEAAEMATGFSRKELVGSDFCTYFIERECALEACKYTFLGGVVRDQPLTLLHVSGQQVDVLYNASVYRDEAGQVQGVLAAVRDITERKYFEQQLEHQATHDALTGLPNRALFQDRLLQAMAQYRRNGGSVAVMFVDLDNFKNINDSLGHATGDALLKDVAGRVSGELRESDTVARLGGDEFAILLQDGQGIQDLDNVARKILEVIARPCNIDEQLVFANASMGIAIYPLDGEDAATLMRNADTAMYYAKRQGRNGYRYYSHEMNHALRERMTLAADLRLALERGEFELHYQPKADLRTGNICGLEALLRWRHPQGSMISPAHFIPVAEEYGLIAEVGAWVIDAACCQMRRWLDDGLDPVRIAVNLSAGQFLFDDVVVRMREALTTHGIPGERLEVEITESMVMSDIEQAVRTFQDIKALGVNVAIDDFGTGYSSLSYLKRLPIDSIKIDKSFVDDIEFDSNSIVIIRAIDAMAHCMELRVVAEGVENEIQLSFLRTCGCDEMQGYYFSKPLPAGDVGALLRRGWWLNLEVLDLASSI